MRKLNKITQAPFTVFFDRQPAHPHFQLTYPSPLCDFCNVNKLISKAKHHTPRKTHTLRALNTHAKPAQNVTKEAEKNYFLLNWALKNAKRVI